MSVRSSIAVAAITLAAWSVPVMATPPSAVYYDRSTRHTDPWADRPEQTGPGRPGPHGRAPVAKPEESDDEQETIKQLAKQVKELTKQVKELNEKLESGASKHSAKTEEKSSHEGHGPGREEDESESQERGGPMQTGPGGRGGMGGWPGGRMGPGMSGRMPGGPGGMHAGGMHAGGTRMGGMPGGHMGGPGAHGGPSMGPSWQGRGGEEPDAKMGPGHHGGPAGDKEDDGSVGPVPLGHIAKQKIEQGDRPTPTAGDIGKPGEKAPELPEGIKLPDGLKLQPGDKVIIIIRGKGDDEEAGKPSVKAKAPLHSNPEKQDDADETPAPKHVKAKAAPEDDSTDQPDHGRPQTRHHSRDDD